MSAGRDPFPDVRQALQPSGIPAGGIPPQPVRGFGRTRSAWASVTASTLALMLAAHAMPAAPPLLAQTSSPVQASGASVIGASRAQTGVSAAAHPRVSFWRHPKNRNMMRLEEWPNGEIRFWAHQLDPKDDYTREVLARRGLQIDVKEMTDEYVLRFCGFGYDNGLKYTETTPGSSVFEAVVAVGFDFFRGVEQPKYGETRWRVTIRRIDEQRLYLGGRLIGWRGALLFGQVKAEAELVRIAQPPDACTPSPVYPVRAPRTLTNAVPRPNTGQPTTMAPR